MRPGRPGVHPLFGRRGGRTYPSGSRSRGRVRPRVRWTRGDDHTGPGSAAAYPGSACRCGFRPGAGGWAVRPEDAQGDRGVAGGGGRRQQRAPDSGSPQSKPLPARHGPEVDVRRPARERLRDGVHQEQVRGAGGGADVESSRTNTVTIRPTAPHGPRPRIGRTTHRSGSPAGYRAGTSEPVGRRSEPGDRAFAAPVRPIDACRTLSPARISGLLHRSP